MHLVNDKLASVYLLGLPLAVGGASLDLLQHHSTGKRMAIPCGHLVLIAHMDPLNAHLYIINTPVSWADVIAL